MRHRRRLRMRGGDRAADRVGECGVDPARPGKTIKRLRLVEATHLDGVFDWLALAADREPPIGLAGDHRNAPMARGRVGTIDLDLGLAGRLALRKRGIVEEWELHGALELERAPAGEEHHGGMGIDALDRRAAMGRRIHEESEDWLLGEVRHRWLARTKGNEPISRLVR